MSKLEVRSNKDTPTPGPSHGSRSRREAEDLPLYTCSDAEGCVNLQDILKSFNAPISEEQAWALIHRFVFAYRDTLRRPEGHSRDFRVPVSPRNYKLHRDGTVHVQFSGEDVRKYVVTSQKKVLQRIGCIVYKALDYNFSPDEECVISPELDQLINVMTYEDVDDEGIERDSEDAVDGEKFVETKEMDHVLELCSKRVSPSFPNDHYKAVCRALATESIELRVFLQKVLQGEAEVLRIQADAETSQQELDKLGFNDWSEVRIWRALQARFWMQVVDELRRGVRLKKCSFSRTPVEYELTPYEILMEDIRSRKYNLRKVMVNGDIPQRVKKDAHAVILEFIRSRPPLKKASERKLPPLKAKPTPRDQLLDSIRKGRVLKPIPRHKTRLMNSCQMDNAKRGETPTESQTSSPRTSRQRLIPVDPALFQDEDLCYEPAEGDDGVVLRRDGGSSGASARKGAEDSTANNENNPNSVNTVLRRTRNTITHDEYHRFCDTALESYDLATQCESRRASMRRHTIVGCHQGVPECQSMPPSRPESRQSESVTVTAPENLTSMETWSKNSLDEKEWKEANISDRLSLTLKEIMHIRSVITKADLELLPVEVKIKEDVEKRKVCFLCLKTRFSIFGPWGVLCKLCQKTVCSKCYSKMRIPTEHFRNVPVMLLSPSLVSSPTASGAPSPSHYGHGTGVDMESFPRSLMERLLRPESERKTRNTVGSAPSSPKHQRSTSSTPGSSIVVDEKIPVTIKDPISHTRVSSIMSRSMEGPRSLPPQSPARPHSNSSTLDRRNRFTTLTAEQKEGLRGELMAVCNDCRGLVLEIIRSSRQTRSTARNIVLKNLTLDLSPVYKRW